jgi:hypothetical protein
MDRRDALKAFLALPAAATISRAQLTPDDVIVIETHAVMSMERCETLAAHVRQIWPAQKVLVLQEGLTLKIVRALEDARPVS